MSASIPNVKVGGVRMDLGKSGVSFKFALTISPGKGGPYFPTASHEFETPTLKYADILRNIEKAGRDIRAEGHRFADKWRNFWRKRAERKAAKASGDRGDGGKAGAQSANGPSGSDDHPMKHPG